MRSAFPLLATFTIALNLVCHADASRFAQQAKVDQMLQEVIDRNLTAGLSCAIVQDGKVIYTKGFGVKNVATQDPVDPDTLFMIASCTKAFSCFSLMQLVDDGKISLEDKVIQHLPQFKLQDPLITTRINLTDLMAHRSGLPRHDSVWFNTTFPRAEFLNRLPYLPLSDPIRTKFLYNNLLYATLALVIEKVSNQTWEAFTQERIFNPLGMSRSSFTIKEMQASGNYAFPHVENNNQLQTVAFRDVSNVGAAGSINSTARDLAQWVLMQLGNGKYNGVTLLSEENLAITRTAHMPYFKTIDEEGSSYGYGLGWTTGFLDGSLILTHDGNLEGFGANITLIPEKKIGIAVLNNSSSHLSLSSTISFALLQVLQESDAGNWLDRMLQAEADQLKNKEQNARLGESKPETLYFPLLNYTGTYFHPGYGELSIELIDGALQVVFNALRYRLTPICYNQFKMDYLGNLPFEFDAVFQTGQECQINGVEINFEPLVDPIPFIKIQ